VSQVLPVLLVLLVRPALVIPVQLVQQGPLVPPALSLGKVLLGLLGQLATAPPDLQVPQEPMGALGLVLKLLNCSPTTTQELQAKIRRLNKLHLARTATLELEAVSIVQVVVSLDRGLFQAKTSQPKTLKDISW